MELSNAIVTAKEDGLGGSELYQEAIETLLLLMAPNTPHITEELWSRIGNAYSIHNQSWPEFNPELAREDEITLVVQVNGKVRDRITVPADINESDAKETALQSEAVQRHLSGKEPRKVIVVPGRLVNIVV
jgi:leucyl-tRNA synthetase